MSNLVAFSKAGLPAVQDLASTLRKLETTNNVGSVIIKMDKTGHWVFGADQTEAEPEARWAVNPFSFTHGFIAWGDGEVLGEKMVNISEPLPDLGVAPPAAKKGWEAQVGMSLKCLSGEDANMDARYSVTSVGGKKAVQTLAVAIATQVEKDPSKPVPVVHLKKEHYQHKSYGRIYTPVFEIVDWISMDGEAQEEPAAEAAPEAGASGRRRRS
ncbi:hypothetical protein UFOVP830_32 [uncultured Caudovirales phage]|uniref:Uncharacterized protein n=1 Tax=uncultured Caudovirales phage TaxID=2100421 RepID=A0A6J5NY25_9CAUD|nr:hypothetical protein UFOVP830_32 [uncultured Caudovirales phage]